MRLELFREDHLAAMPPLLADPDVLRFTLLPVPVPDGFLPAWYGRYEEGRREGTRELFAIVEGGEFLGTAMAPTIDAEARMLELGYMVAPAARGRGVATQALTELTDWAFATHDALRLELRISVDNTASKRVAERARYVREGVLRSVYLKQGMREDLEIWSRLPGDP